ncbi:hypothetical protein [Marinobacter sp. ELB17]|uniref:hypothetical protein n=1 Tax=Marinobacter sp. ELB17 TaxID=270374 RepID=UPI0000F3A836|nr:hypothetical protein [Marinobacter sp. ELB17]EAZ98221.1 hypothetical protein MELB17_08286 [Marinobacter sp. ELB17]
MANTEAEIRLYERGEGRHKHRWKHDFAGFEPGDKGQIGKCPKSITEQLATEILNQGVPYYDDLGDEIPSKIYSVHKGVIYEAAPTMPGISWHGYPWRGNLRGRRPLSSRIVRKLKKMAEKSGHSKEFEQWLKQYG